MQWARMFVKRHGLPHPRDMGWQEIEDFLAMLANMRRVAIVMHNQAERIAILLPRSAGRYSLWQRDGAIMRCSLFGSRPHSVV